MKDKTISEGLKRDMLEELAWAAEFVEKQAEFCEETAEQESDVEQKESDLESAKEFYALAKRMRVGEELSEVDIYDILWIMHEEFHELELEVEG